MSFYVLISVLVSALFKGLAIYALTNQRLEEYKRKKYYFLLNIGFYVFVAVAFVLLFIN